MIYGIGNDILDYRRIVKIMEKYPNAKLVGKTNRQNLVFEMNDEQLRVNTKGQII